MKFCSIFDSRERAEMIEKIDKAYRYLDSESLRRDIDIILESHGIEKRVEDITDWDLQDEVLREILSRLYVVGNSMLYQWGFNVLRGYSNND